MALALILGTGTPGTRPMGSVEAPSGGGQAGMQPSVQSGQNRDAVLGAASLGAELSGG